jgi:hypothetical protein
LAFVADCSLYEFWQFKLDASCLTYLSTPKEAMASVSTGYLLLHLLIVIALSCLFCLAYLLPYYRYLLKAEHISRRSSGNETIIGLLCIPLLVIGIRGGISESTTNIGQVYYSQNQFLNHAAVNPVFSFFASFEKTANYIPDYHFMDDKVCEQIVNEYKSKQNAKKRALRSITETQSLIKKYENMKKDCIMPNQSIAWQELGKKIKALRKQS